MKCFDKLRFTHLRNYYLALEILGGTSQTLVESSMSPKFFFIARMDSSHDITQNMSISAEAINYPAPCLTHHCINSVGLGQYRWHINSTNAELIFLTAAVP